MDPQPWMGQIGLAAAAVVLFLTVGKSYINYISKQVQDERASHEREIVRLTASWEARLADANRRADSWETAAHRYEEAGRQDRAQVEKLLTVNETTVSLLTAIREGQMRQ